MVGPGDARRGRRPPGGPVTARDRLAVRAIACLVALIISLTVTILGFLAWQYLMPDAFQSSFLLNHAGVAHFRATLGIGAAPLPVHAYRVGFRAWLLASWVAYLAMLLAGAAGAPVPGRR